jgi:nitrate reductase NapE
LSAHADSCKTRGKQAQHRTDGIWRQASMLAVCRSIHDKVRADQTPASERALRCRESGQWRHSDLAQKNDRAGHSPIAIRQMNDHDVRDTRPASTRQDELRSFLFFTVVMAPVLAFLVVGGYGFLVWMYQLIAGPPTA